MKTFLAFFLVAFWNTSTPSPNGSVKLNDFKIARAVRKAVRNADSTLLNDSSLNAWRDYLKVAALELRLQLQPLVLIKFDEDIGFRNQLKTIIEWESLCQTRITEHFIYYFKWDKPLPEMILQVQDAHYNELAKLFQIEALEKIPFRYDLTVDSCTVFPYEDLRGGIVSPYPFDLKNGALAIFSFLNSESFSLLEPLSIIYGSYFQNPSTSLAYYENCLKEVNSRGYIPAANLFTLTKFDNSSSQEWFSAYAFAFRLIQKYGPPKIAHFLSQINSEMSLAEFQNTFNDIFGLSLSEFEKEFTGDLVQKM